MATSKKQLETEIEDILEQLNIKIAASKKNKFKDAIFGILQDKYLELNLEIRREINPQLYKKELK